MRIRFFSFLLFMMAMPSLAFAQNVLVPSGSSTAATAKPAATSPAPGPTTTTSTDTTADNSSSALSTLIGGQSTPVPTAATIYISPAQQNALIQAEQQHLASQQHILMQMQQVDQSMAMQAATPGQTQAQQALVAQSQQSNTQNSADVAAQIRKTQQQLAILKSGPLKASDLAAFYQSN